MQAARVSIRGLGNSYPLQRVPAARRARSSSSPNTSTLVGLTALLIGGVGIANSVKYYLDRKRDVIATLKSMGATGARIFVIYFTEILLLALAGSAIGLLVGAALPFAAAGGFGALVPLPFVPKIFRINWHWRSLTGC